MIWIKEEQKLYDRCLRCGRKLKNEQARLRGFGDVCYKKHLMENTKVKLF